MSKAEKGAVAQAVDSESLWDVHMCMNALNRVTGRLHADTSTLNLIFAVAEHLRIMARIQRQGPDISPELLRDWIVALFSLKMLLEGQPGDPQCEIEIVGELAQVPLGPLTKILKQIARYAGSVRGIVLQIDPVRQQSLLKQYFDGKSSHFEVKLELIPHTGREPLVADFANVPELKEKMASFKAISGGRYEAKFVLPRRSDAPA